mmetsp:Transcript_69745/g.194956  ORF Transcript_69745/g.194956 Transcript_69745/m.194956 type:complete len:214 (-) Transcript_69745:271-912(-)
MPRSPSASATAASTSHFCFCLASASLARRASFASSSCFSLRFSPEMVSTRSISTSLSATKERWASSRLESCCWVACAAASDAFTSARTRSIVCASCPSSAAMTVASPTACCLSLRSNPSAPPPPPLLAASPPAPSRAAAEGTVAVAVILSTFILACVANTSLTSVEGAAAVSAGVMSATGVGGVGVGVEGGGGAASFRARRAPPNSRLRRRDF